MQKAILLSCDVNVIMTHHDCQCHYIFKHRLITYLDQIEFKLSYFLSNILNTLWKETFVCVY